MRLAGDDKNMAFSPRRRVATLVVLAVSAAFLAACGSSGQKSMTSKKTRSKEYFAESEYGVKASPRVTNKRTRLQRGGGRDQIGKPYKVRGKWYVPKEDRNYSKVGAASWYGDAFHGRLTANGEIYDMTHLTAAHPTMPLPSYARVTNVKNGSSIIVRVNDRGPYAHNRIIDLSKRAAELLDYTHGGVAKVKVEYVGRAPLHGRDDQYLMASYRPGKGGRRDAAPDPSEGLATGVMIAMNGRTPSAAVPAAAPFPGNLADAEPATPVVVAAAPVAASAMPETVPFGTTDVVDDVVFFDDPALPDLGPLIPERPLQGFGVPQTQVALAAMSYADDRVRRSGEPFAAFAGTHGMTPGQIVASWKRQTADANPGNEPYVTAGSFDSREEASGIAGKLARFGRTSLEKSDLDGATWYTVNLYGASGVSVDDLLETAWANGAPDAMAIRN